MELIGSVVDVAGRTDVTISDGELRMTVTHSLGALLDIQLQLSIGSQVLLGELTHRLASGVMRTVSTVSFRAHEISMICNGNTISMQS